MTEAQGLLLDVQQTLQDQLIEESGVSKTQISRQYEEETGVIVDTLAGGTSVVIDFRDFSGGSIFIPSTGAWGTQTCLFYVAINSTDTFQQLFDRSNAALTINVDRGQVNELPPEIISAPFVKIVAPTTLFTVSVFKKG